VQIRAKVRIHAASIIRIGLAKRSGAMIHMALLLTEIADIHRPLQAKGKARTVLMQADMADMPAKVGILGFS
jgi:hypothetical protein